MSFPTIAIAALLAIGLPGLASAQSTTEGDSGLLLELNALQERDGACRLTFLAQNGTGAEIDKAVFETVVFDAGGKVESLSLFDFRDLPADRPRVRQFDLPGMACDAIGQVLINGASTCIVNGGKSDVCNEGLSLSSRLPVELLG